MPQAPSFFVLALLMYALLSPTPAGAQIQGRGWTRQARIEVPGYAFLASPLIEQDSQGAPILYAYGGSVSGNRTLRIAWKDSTWVPEWELPFPCTLLWPVPTTLPNTHTLIWKVGAYSANNDNASDLVWSDADRSGLVDPDTLGIVWPSTSEYAAAVTSKRRWAAVSDYTNFRFFERRGNAPTVEWDVPDQADMGIAIGALSDTTALVVWGSLYFGFRWAIAGDTWRFGGDVPDATVLSARPRLRKRPSGGLWLAWGGEETIVLRSFHEGEWGPYREFTSDFGDGQAYYGYSPDVSRDEREWPTVAWSRILARTFTESICVSVPDEAGNYSSHFVPESDEGWLPTVLRDRFGDVWVAWMVWVRGAYWTHTYTRAEPTRPSLVRTGAGVRVSWTISEPAPGSHWAVVRAIEDMPPETMGSVIAGAETLMTWLDSGAQPSGQVRYWIRRESVDRRFEMTSPEAELHPLAPLAFAILSDGGNPARGSLPLKVVGAAPGPVIIEVFDGRGRLIARERATSPAPPEVLRFAVTPGSRFGSGVVFARATDSTGRKTEVRKLVVLR